MIAEIKPKVITTLYDRVNPFWYVQNAVAMLVIAAVIILIAAVACVSNALDSK
jgi:hypothetical protein